MLQKAFSKLNQPLELSLIIKISIGLGLLLFAYEFFYLDVYSLWWPSLIIFPPLIGFLFIIWNLISIILIPFFIKITTWRSFLPAIINGIIFFSAVYFFYPVRHLRIETEFLIKHKSFEQVVAMINSGEIQSDQYGEAILPKEYQNISMNGEVRFYTENNNLYIYFDTNNAIVFPRAYYVYCSNGQPPNADERLRVYEINSYWYFVSYL